MRRRLTGLLALVLSLPACTPAPSARGPVAAARSSNPVKKLDPTKPVVVPGAGKLVPVGGQSVVPDDPRLPAATRSAAAAIAVAGTVRAPAGLISDHGDAFIGNNSAGVVANNAAGVLANHGAGYRTLAVEQAPLAGARVFVLDAQGRTLAGQDGQALFATTDAQGRYAFTGALPRHNFLLAVELADGKGRWQAVLPRDAADPTAIDLDLISTLTTGYILGKYVEGQADQQATLDRLPALAEATTRGRAGAAFERANQPLPGRFDASTTVPLVEGLRQQDPAFDAQMEAVRQLLIAAGQSDFGNGQPATKVRFGRLQTVIPLADGGFWLCSQDDGRIWSMDAAGILHTLAGTGVKGAPAAAGLLATQAPLDGPAGIARDDEGRLILPDGERLLRVEADGRLAIACEQLGVLPDAVFAIGRDAYAVADDQGALTFVAGGVASTPLRPDGASVGRLHSAGRRGDGAIALIHVAAGGAYGTNRTVDVAGKPGLPTTLPGKPMGVAPDGTWVSLGADGSLIFTPPAGAPIIFSPDQVAQLPDYPPFNQLKANKVNADGFWNLQYAFGNGRGYVFSAYEVHELAQDGRVRHVAGLDPGRVASGDASGVALDTPTGVALAPDGTLYLTDNALKQVLKRDAAGAVTRHAGVGGLEAARLTRGNLGKASLAYGSHPAIEFGATYQAPAAEARFSFPSLIRVDAKGQVLVLDMGMFLRRLEPNGDLRSIYDAGVTGGHLADYMPEANGTIVLALAEERGSQIARLAPDGQLRTLVDVPEIKASAQGEPLAVAKGPDGMIYVLVGDGLAKLGVAKLIPLATDPRLAVLPDRALGTVVRMAVDSASRVYVTSGDNVLRWTPGAAAFEVLAGPGGRLLAGATADDSLQAPMSPVFGPNGDLYVVDNGNKQIKRIPAAQL